MTIEDTIEAALSPVAGGASEVFFEIEGVEHLDVRWFSVTERLGTPTEVRVVVAAKDEMLALDALSARPATLTLRVPVPMPPPMKKVVERRYTGVVITSARLRREEKGLTTYSFDVSSDVELLRYRKTSRVFQHQTELEIVETLLGEWEVPFRTEVDRSQLARRKYKIQRDETDFDFIHRLLEESGITYCFEGTAERSILVLSDTFHTRPERDPALTYVPELGGLHSGADHATATHEFLEAASTKYTVRDSDHRRDAKQPQEETAALEAQGPLARAERYQFRPGAFLFETDRTGDVTPVADQRQMTRTNPAQARLLVQRRLAAQRSSSRRWSFGSDAFDLQPSTVLRVEGDRLLEGRKLLVLSTSITGSRLDAWHVATTVVPAEPWRPALETPRPAAHGLEPATVVGPEGEEIHVDEFGRVKIQFHWDREGKHDDESSCWVPVSSGWAGTGYGAIMIPRIGHEVLVEFLGGDPDRPIVTGRVFSHLHPTPYKLPDEKSVTVIAKTSSLGGSGGYNEIKADDRGGKELLYVQAERDLETLVKREERRTVGVDRTTRVGNVDTLDVGSNRRVIVGGVEQREFTSPRPNAPRTVQTNTSGLNKMEVGSSVVEVTPQGVRIVGTLVEIECTDFKVTMKGTGLLNATGNIDIKSAALVKLNCD